MEASWEAGLTEVRGSFWRRRRWVKWLAGVLLLALALAALLVNLGLQRAEPFLRARIVEALENRFHARVELDGFRLSLIHGLSAEGRGLRIWSRTDQAEPLIRLDQFSFHAPGKPIHISVVEVKGLSIHIPPKLHDENASGVLASQIAPAEKPRSAIAGLVSFDVDTMECTGADLLIETSKPGKLPMDFAIRHLKLTNISAGGAIGFDAELTNPRPTGAIKATGSFGPLIGTNFGEAPVVGEYRFDHADLSGFNGIAGILTSTGRFQGTLRELIVDGETKTPDFRLTHFGNPMPLSTRFHARVDGTNGDTWLEPVDATLGHSHFIAQGQIERVAAVNSEGAPRFSGHDIALTVTMNGARIEDFLRLASHSGNVLLTGDLVMQTTLHIPPGPAPVHQRLELAGKFALENAQFTSQKIQKRIAELSLRGQGRPDELKTADPASFFAQMKGDFRLADEVITLPALKFEVPGAEIELKGAYQIEGGLLNFDGNARMEASVSRMVGGWKGLLISPADRFFKKDGAGTEVPIHIEGSREEPKFGIDFDRMKRQENP